MPVPHLYGCKAMGTLQFTFPMNRYNQAILGNYAIIDHNNGEFSLDAHMSEGTLKVEVGDAANQGQVIGRVGNTSNSEGPHPHFHLMDLKDFQTGNGLPVMFKNLPAGQAQIYDIEETNSLLYSDYLFVHIPEEPKERT